MIKIKICGLRREQDIDYVNALSPDYIGFIFAKDRRRYIPPDKAAALRARLNGSITPVGVFVNETIDGICAIASTGTIGMIQLHGQEDDDYIAALRQKTSLPIIKAFPVAGAADIARATDSTADHILLDNGVGGTGSAFDWSLLASLPRPFFLAGGVTPENIAEALSLRPYGIDVSSGVETDGYKDFTKMQQIIQTVRKD